MINAINTLFPVFTIIAIGFWLGQRGSLSKGFLGELNWLIFWISLPALIIHSLATADAFPVDALSTVAVFFGATLIVIALAFAASWWLKLPSARIGTFVQSAFRGNLAFAGLPIVIFAVRANDPGQVGAAVAQTVFILAPAMLLYNVIAVFLLVFSSQGFAASKLKLTLKKVAQNPLILASLAGVGLFALPIEAPRFALNTLELIGQMAAPAALFCVGGTMAFVFMQGRYRSASVACVLKVLAMPAVTAGLLLFVEVDPIGRIVLLILSACPTAVASYIMAKELDGDEALAAGSIIITTITCIPVMGLIIVLG